MKTIIYTTAIIFSIANCFAQCPDGKVYYTSGDGTEIQVYDPSLPISAANPTGTGIFGGVGLAYGPNLNAVSPSPTFYTTSSSNGIISYWDGTAWVSTGATGGSSATNIGMTNGVVYAFNILSGNIYSYNGTGSSTLLTTIPGSILDYGIADVVGDGCGNFYIFRSKKVPQVMEVYGSTGTLLGSYTITGFCNCTGGGFAIIGNNIYATNTSTTGSVAIGTISGSNIDFSSTVTFPTTPSDFASCPATSTSFCVLPIKLLTFTASCLTPNPSPKERGVRVAWSTATETNNDYFTIERSTSPDPSKGGALNWEVAGTVKGAGNSSTIRSYKFIDNQVLPFGEDLGGVVYYRLKQTDFDGKTETFNSNQVAVDVTECAVQVFPNPAGNTLNIPYTAEQDGEITLQVYDVIGKLVKEKLVTAVKGHNTFTIDLTTVAQGMYVLRVKGTDKENNQKFVKE